MIFFHAFEPSLMQYYTSPISGYTFNMKSEVLDYLFSQADERILESKESGAENTFQVHRSLMCKVFIVDMFIYIYFCKFVMSISQKEHKWLLKGWVMEIRAGGEKMDKMYKVKHHEFGYYLVPLHVN